MTELVLSDITVMGPGYCVLGLEQISGESFRSIRPMPPWAFAWREPFPFHRGDRVTVRPRTASVAAPHFEDRLSDGLKGTGHRMPEERLVQCLRKAEFSGNLEGLFGCSLQRGSRGGQALWVHPAQACRSVCGCEYENLRFCVYPEPEGHTLRAEIVLASNERIPSVPVVDRDWRAFVGTLIKRVRRSDPLPLVERFLNRTILPKFLSSPHRLARIGLPRPREDQQCWLMLDSLFPQPQETWLDLL